MVCGGSPDSGPQKELVLTILHVFCLLLVVEEFGMVHHTQSLKFEDGSGALLGGG